MDDALKRWRCQTCRTITLGKDLLTAPNPFDPSDTLTGCPKCKMVEGFDAICDEPGCVQASSCGFNTSEGYRRTCHEHSDWAKERRAAAIGTGAQEKS